MKKLFDSDGIVLYQGDAKELVPTLPKSYCLISDVPFGMRERRDYGAKGRVGAKNFAPIVGDYEPFDPTFLLGFKLVFLFGANYFANKLPCDRDECQWVVWDKIYGLHTDKRNNGEGFCDNADAEIAWVNKKGPVRLLRYQWTGILKQGERGELRVHPTQKPVALMEQIIRLYTQKGDTIVDPYGGSFTTAVAAWRLGRRCICCEITEDYAQVGLKRVKDAQGAGFMTEMQKQLKLRIARKNRAGK